MDKFCSACGTALEEGARFCAKCGKPVNGTEAAAGPTYIAGTNIVWPTGERLKIFLFALFLGIFGGHCFYTGRRGRGLIELLLGVTSLAAPFITIMSDDIWSVLSGGFSAMYVPIIVGTLAFLAFCVLFVMDLIKIFQGRFNKVESAVTIQLTKKQLIFLGVLLGLSVVANGLWLPIKFLVYPAVLLCGVFFGPLPGTIIAGLFTVTERIIGIPFYAIVSAIRQDHLFNLSMSITYSLFEILEIPFVTAITAGIVYGCLKFRSLESKLNLKLPDITGKPILQGVLIGIACFVALGICSLLRPFEEMISPWSMWYPPFFYSIIYAAVAGLMGAALPPLLAKKGLYLGPFVTPGQTEVEKNK
ncbi:MAG: zinc-ribbon domain-containing protein [Treponema sp.]|jgi:TM2 domain-containing membrane protein YozV|nr:zinc-ribbon domain-containing protein [Treponema sp.]